MEVPDNAQHQLHKGKLIQRCLWVPILTCCLVIVLGMLVPLLRPGLFPNVVWDDAYMFARYADNVLGERAVSWNPGGEPTYGLSSLLHLVVVVLVKALLSTGPMLTVVLASLLCGVVFVTLLVVVVARHVDGTPLTSRTLLLGLFLLLFLGAARTHWLVHFWSGMDTTFAMAFLAAYILMCKWHERSGSRLSTIAAGILGGLAFLARPDLMLYAFLVPAFMIAFAHDRTARQTGIVLLAVTAVITGVLVVAAWCYFGTPVPLAFYAKGLGLYGDSIHRQYQAVPLLEFGSFARSYWYLLLMLGAGLLVDFRGWMGRNGSPVDKGLLVATLLFALYYLFFVLQIMHYHQRFYYPVLPALIFLGVQGCARLIGRIPEERRRTWVLDWSRYLLPGVALVWVALLPDFIGTARDVLTGLVERRFATFDVAADYRADWSHYWYRLDEFSALPDDLVLATTEVGRPGAMNPGKTVIDLSGLNETVFARQGFSTDLLFETYKPDLIYMPHPHYEDMIAQISNHLAFQEHYEFYASESLGGVVLDVALRRDSKYYEDMRRIVVKGLVGP